MTKFCLLLLLLPSITLAQQELQGGYSVDADYFYGNILPHRKSMTHLITGHPEGLILSFNKRTFGDAEWQQEYNYPDYGASFLYQDMKNESLGEMYGIYGHFNFYFLQRHLMLRVGQGIAYNTNPYDKETNFRNTAYGSRLMPCPYFMLNFKEADLWQGLGVHAGMTFIHYSNGSIKAPNTSTNTFAISAGVNYTFSRKEANVYIDQQQDSVSFSQPIKYTIAFKGGMNESDIIGSGQYPYYALSLYADKRWSRKSALQVGADIFWPTYLKEYIKFKSVSYPEEDVDADTDYKKVGLFAGYELFINNFSAEVQAGVYVYSPFNSTGSLYQRIGLKYYACEHIFASMGLKTHAAKAEVVECGLGVRL